jgi:hypothetical protein
MMSREVRLRGRGIIPPFENRSKSRQFPHLGIRREKIRRKSPLVPRRNRKLFADRRGVIY